MNNAIPTAEIKPSDPKGLEYLTYLRDISLNDTTGLIEAQRSYGNSWKKRGGVGSFMQLARKWDRLEVRMARIPVLAEDSGLEFTDGLLSGDRFDIFQHLIADDRAEGVIDDIRDLRRYLLLMEAEAQAMNVPSAMSTHRDHVVTPPVQGTGSGGSKE